MIIFAVSKKKKEMQLILYTENKKKLYLETLTEFID